MFFSVPLAFSLLATFFTGAGCWQSSNSLQCSRLAASLPLKVSYPGNTEYLSSIASYFFTSARLEPTCIVFPETTEDVVAIVQILGSGNASFAVRGGGHSPNPGNANIQPGVTIDMRSINNISIDYAGPVTSIGAGARWGDVYEVLAPHNLMVLGGRDAGPGAGGLITGGGLSYLSPAHGFSCDQVVNMEVVLASGQVVNANQSSHPDLFTALKGGSNNFGIVTRFDLKTFAQGLSWGGAILYPESVDSQQLDAYYQYKDTANFDPAAESELSFLYETPSATFTSSNIIFYSKPVANPPTFQPFTSITPQLLDTTRISNISDFATEVHSFQPTNKQGVFATTTFTASRSFLGEVHALWRQTIPFIQNVSNLTYVLVLQAVPPVVPGNSMKIQTVNGTTQPLTLLLLSHFWQAESDSPLVLNVTRNLINNIEALAKKQGRFNSFKYLNYAAGWQDVLGSYGASSVRQLKAVSEKYDPTKLFQYGAPGGFKLF